MATPLVLPYEILNSDKTVFFRHLGSFIGRDIPLDETIRSNKKHNVKANHYINYKLRIFNSFIYSSSVNNYSILHNRSSEILFIRIKQIINYFSSKNKDKLIQNKLKKDISSRTKLIAHLTKIVVYGKTSLSVIMKKMVNSTMQCCAALKILRT